MKPLSILAVVLATIAINPGGARGQVTYTYTTIDVPGSGFTEAWGINNIGQTVGHFSDNTGDHGFVRSAAGVFTTFDVPTAVLPAAVYTVGFGINNAGQIAGTAGNASNVSQGFLRSAGGDITPVGPVNGDVQGINGAGQFVGYVGSGGNVLGLLLTGGSSTTFSVPGSTNTFAYGINSAGLIAGQWDSTGGSGYHGFLRTAAGSYTTFDYPGATSTYPFGMNEAGDTVGGLERPGFPLSGFLRTAAGTFSVISFPGASSTEATGINSLGQIVGVYADASGGHSFLATPVPEPSSLVLLGIGGLTVFSRCRRRVV